MLKNDFKRFKQAVWEIRKKYEPPRLTKKQLAEVFMLYKQADMNRAKFAELMRGVIKGG